MVNTIRFRLINWNLILFTISQLIFNQMEFRSAQNQSEKAQVDVYMYHRLLKLRTVNSLAQVPKLGLQI